MSKVVDPESVSWSLGRPVMHPWDEWFDGNAHELERHVDFDGQLSSMRTQVYSAARKRGVVVRTSTDEQREVLFVQQIGEATNGDLSGSDEQDT